eukprot:TRINITY_DN202_c0_g5_i1.p1 TRINITY_DN202_c0_g5~~TRINITY_DN202_c0_g5_i1.p1  ORF type:complete len:214 (+),score=49.67 TRINITY_DN202_c0_g5_i1:69-710(+)
MHQCIGVGAYVLAHSLSNDQVNGLTGMVIRMQGERAVVGLPAPFGESALKRENVRLIPDKVGVWEKVLSNSTSPGDFYWYNWDSGDSIWELPEEVRKALLEGNLDEEPSDFSSSSSKKRTISEVSEEPPMSEEEEGSENAEEDSTAATNTKLDELVTLRNRLAQLESAKKRKIQQLQQTVTVARKSIDAQLSYLSPLEHGLRSLPADTVPLAD